MPTDPTILGFSNHWYPSAMKHAEFITLPSGNMIRLVSAPYFLMTKLEAFDGRGNGDYQLSHDIEDIVAVLDGRPDLIEEVGDVENGLKLELANRFNQLLADRRFVEALAGHLPNDSASQARLPLIIKRIKDIVEIQ